MPRLLDRDTFREATFARDGHRCVICGRSAGGGLKLDAHHIVERRLFRGEHERGGYFLDNAATLCDDGTIASCHLRAEATVLTCEQIRAAAGIRAVLLPEHLHAARRYTKWGDAIGADDLDQGELYGEEGVRKVLLLGGALHRYTGRLHAPRIPHLRTSPGAAAPGAYVLRSTDAFVGHRVIVTEKRTGPLATACAQRVVGEAELPAALLSDIPDGVGIELVNGQAFRMWDHEEGWLPWDDLVEWATLLDLPVVPVLYDGLWDESVIAVLPQPFVVRIASAFRHRAFGESVAQAAPVTPARPG